jgi:site-specific recombinase XerC
MFQETNNNEVTPTIETTDTNIQEKYKNIINIYPNMSETTEMNYNTIDQLLEKEKQYNKTEQWTKLDKTIKIQKLHQYAEKYGKTNSLPAKDVKTLKTFFVDCLEKNKLNKTKDVLYDKEKRDITSIPALHFNSQMRNFTLKIIDTKRVSTLKSLTPKQTNLG